MSLKYKHKALNWKNLADHYQLARTVFGTVSVHQLDNKKWCVALYGQHSKNSKTRTKVVQLDIPTLEEAKTAAIKHVDEATDKFLKWHIQ